MESQIEVEVELKMADMLVSMLLCKDRVFVEIEDTRAGACSSSAQRSVSPLQAAAILFLAMNGDTGEESLITRLYELTEPVVEKLPLNLRPIP